VREQDEAHPDLKQISQSLAGLDPQEKKRLAAATVREATDDFKGEVAAAALQAVPHEERKELVAAAVRDVPDEMKSDLAAAAVRAVPDEARKNLVAAAVEATPNGAKLDAAAAAVQAVPDDMKRDVVARRYRTHPATPRRRSPMRPSEAFRRMTSRSSQSGFFPVSLSQTRYG
jgi:hypothetical protein